MPQVAPLVQVLTAVTAAVGLGTTVTSLAKGKKPPPTQGINLESPNLYGSKMELEVPDVSNPSFNDQSSRQLPGIPQDLGQFYQQIAPPHMQPIPDAQIQSPFTGRF